MVKSFITLGPDVNVKTFFLLYCRIGQTSLFVAGQFFLAYLSEHPCCAHSPGRVLDCYTQNNFFIINLVGVPYSRKILTFCVSFMYLMHLSLQNDCKT